jgi:predicted nuclease of predicted toxin-antitoxin system
MQRTWLKKDYIQFKKSPELRFLLDMGISQSVASWLRGQGHDAVHLNDENLNKLPDTSILEKAVTEKRIIITTDMDFGQLLAFNKSCQTSVIQFRTSAFTPVNIRQKLELLFVEFSDQLAGDFIITIEDNRIRLRKLPI